MVQIERDQSQRNLINLRCHIEFDQLKIKSNEIKELTLNKPWKWIENASSFKKSDRIPQIN